MSTNTHVFKIMNSQNFIIYLCTATLLSIVSGNTDDDVNQPNSFKSLLLSDDIYIDKSIMIAQFVYSRDILLIITRPSKWGKSTNMDMINTFLESEVDENGVFDPSEEKQNTKFFAGGEYVIGNTSKKILKKLKVTSAPGIMSAQGIFPVLKLNFGSIEVVKTYSEFLQQLLLPIQSALKSKQYLRKYYRNANKLLPESEKEHLKRLFTQNTTNEMDLKYSLRLLTYLLHTHRDARVIVLIDDYDNVIHQAFKAFGAESKEYKHIVKLVTEMYNITFNENLHIRKVLLTGKLMTPFEIENTTNALQFAEYSILKEAYSPYYGFTSVEVNDLLNQLATGESKHQEMERWYGGYTYGGNPLYNPWSTLNYFKNGSTFRSYWVNWNEEHGILKDGILSLHYVQDVIRKLIDGTKVQMKINQYVSYVDLSASKPAIENVFSMLLFQGYVNPTEIIPTNDSRNCECILRIPNEELRMFFKAKLEQK